MHRDLKSHNLLVAEGWKIKVCDFGLARSAPNDGDRNLMTIVGTNEWMAPEVAIGENYALSADVFSYGMVLFEIITREKPPQRKLKDMYAFNSEEFKSSIPPDTPEEFWKLLVNCTAHNPDERPTFKDVVKRLLQMIKDIPQGGGTPAPTKEPAADHAHNGKVEASKDSQEKKNDGKKKPATKKITKKSGDSDSGKKKASESTKKKPTKKNRVTLVKRRQPKPARRKQQQRKRLMKHRRKLQKKTSK